MDSERVPKQRLRSSATKRTKSITRHLTNNAAPQPSRFPNRIKLPLSQEDLTKILPLLPNAIDDLEYNVAEHLPGPLQDKIRYPNGWIDAFLDLKRAQEAGENHIKYAEYQQRYGEQGLLSNIVVPQLLIKRKGPRNSGKRDIPIVTQQIIIGDPEDARRIGRVHVTKSPNFTPFLFNSIISTTDDDEWHEMREHLVTAFLPKASLAKIFPVTLERAKFCAERMTKLIAESPDGAVDVNEFMLYETEAQLQLALFGTDREWMDKTNKDFRMAMGNQKPLSVVKDFLVNLLDKVNTMDVVGPATAGVGPETPSRGPLSDALRSLKQEGRADMGNALIFAFAGHDTTAHTLTWLLFELAKNLDIQKKLQKEVDAFFLSLDGRDMKYEDLQGLEFMTKCIMETLRLWPAVANGTFRQFRFDDYIKGPNGESVKVPKGTLCQITNWNRHRSQELWGDDANEFNPDREWKDSEIWNNEVLRAYNPATERFSPFTFAPRDCIGKNFAHMEMRAILCYLLKKYTFTLSDAAASFDKERFLGVNYGTMAPQDLSQEEWFDCSPGSAMTRRRSTGLSLVPILRK
mmetsp:Transcript_19364/g.25226  ORF Transcript_19364/g.25226 Transcript_19364/m.25226 type:complete len:575 (+) Transcript_19364:164-1888(+)